MTITEVIEEDINKTIRVMGDTEIITIEETIEAEVIGEDTKEEITPILTSSIITKRMIRMMKLQWRLPLILVDMSKPLK